MPTNTLDFPEVSGFVPLDERSVFGVDYVRLLSGSGTRLVVSSAGVERLTTDPALRGFVERTGDFMDTEGSCRDIDLWNQDEPCQTLYYRGSPDPYSYGGAVHKASVLVPAAVPSIIVKTYDYNSPFEAAAQFYSNGLLADRRNDHLSGPQPYGLLTSPDGHQITLTERATAPSLSSLLMAARKHSWGIGDQFLPRVQQHVSQELSTMLGRLRPFFALDLHGGNILTESLPSIEDIGQHRYVVIDQPWAIGSLSVAALARSSRVANRLNLQALLPTQRQRLTATVD